MWRAVIVQECLVVQTNGIDHQCVILVMADRLAVPGRVWAFRMGHVEVDVPYLLVARKYHHHFRGRLDEEDRSERVGHETRNARRHATRTRRKGNLAGE